MAWFRVDDQFGSNPKVMQIPRQVRKECLGLWLLAGVWSAQHLTDGRVPEYMLEELGTDMSHRDRLVTVGLWSETGDGIAFNDWGDYQPSRAEVMAKREAERVRKEQWRAKKAESRGKVTDASRRDTDGTDASVRAESALPDPTRPDPAPIKEEVAKATSSLSKRGTRIDPAWIPDQDLINQMRDECPGVDLEAEHKIFIDYWIAQPGQKGVKVDWAATWRNWMRRKRADGARPAPVSRQKPTAGDRMRAIADELRKEGL